MPSADRDSMVELRFLGPVQAIQAGEPLALRSHKALALLGYLAVRQQPVSRDHLSQFFWPDSSERIGRKNLSWTLSHLRRSLPDCLRANRRQVSFQMPPDCWVDVAHFTTLEASGSPAALRELTGLYRGELLTGINLRGCAEFEIWLVGEREKWRRRTMRALETLVHHFESEKEYEAALAAAQQLLALDDWQETTHRHIMRLLALSGQRAQALAQYEQCKQILAAEWGLPPAPETESLRRDIEQGVLVAPRPSALPVHLTPTDWPSNIVPDIGPLPPSSYVPLSPNPLFVGRDPALLTLARHLREGNTIAIGQMPIGQTVAMTGLGGGGKTQLAVEFAHRYGRFFPGGVFWLNFEQPSAISTQVAICGGLEGMSLRPDFEELPLAQRVKLVQLAWQETLPRLLIFDGCEHEKDLAAWRPPHGGCRVIVTSRRGYWDLALGVIQLQLPMLERADSIVLLRRFREDLATAEARAIAQELGDLPLALHLAGSYLRYFADDITPATYLAELNALHGAPLSLHFSAKREKKQGKSGAVEHYQ